MRSTENEAYSCTGLHSVSLAKSVALIDSHGQDWGDELFGALKKAGGTAYSNYAVGYNNVDVDAATKNGIAVGNTPGRPL